MASFPGSEQPFKDQSRRKPTRSVQLSKLEWEELKPLIYRLYIQENRTLASITRSIAEGHGFTPTQKQLTTRLKTWGFRKNTSWLTPNSSYGTLDPASSTSQSSLIDESPKQKIESPETEAPILFPPTSHTSEEEPEYAAYPTPPSDQWQDTSGFTKETIHIKNSPILSTSDVDIVGSPKLTRMFAALELDSSSNIPVLDLPPLALPKAEKAPTGYLTKSDLAVVSGKRTLSMPRNRLETIWNYHPSDPRGFGKWALDARRNHLPPLKWNNAGVELDVLSPSGSLYVYSSPFKEIDAFPNSTMQLPPRRSIGQSPSPTTIEGSLNTIAAMYPENDLRWPLLIGKEAETLYYQGEFGQAEVLYWKQYALYEKILGPESLEALECLTAIAHTYSCSGKIKQADAINSQTHSKISRLYSDNYRLMSMSLQAKCSIYRELGKKKEALQIYRELAQASLRDQGPKGNRSMPRLINLAWSLLETGHQAESERLSHLLLQIARSYFQEWQLKQFYDYFDTFNALSEAVFAQGKYDECEKICLSARQQSQNTLGHDHEKNLRTDYWLARTWRKQGKIRESFALLQRTYQRQTEVLGELHEDTVASNLELADLMTSLSRYAEATVLCERRFWSIFRKVGADHNYTFKAFEEVANSYDLEKRYEDTGHLANEFAAKINEADGEDSIAAALCVNEWMIRRASRLQGVRPVERSRKGKEKEDHDGRDVNMEEFLNPDLWRDS
ncbi:hypothetical protein B0O99DRAFT_627511 [Bisporella sp. PMI_857]|nr:hypothetical protein B0O99DRAFT_627511 [Bisporella sp. PMI_857]